MSALAYEALCTSMLYKQLVLSETGIGGSGAGFGGGVGTTRKAAFMGQARGASFEYVGTLDMHMRMGFAASSILYA